MARYLLLTLVLFLAGGALFGQGTSLQGKVTDADTGEPIIFGNVAVYKNGVLITGTDTDLDGNYSINPLDPGTYEVEFSYTGYQSKKYEGVVVNAGKANRLDATLSAGVTLQEVEVVDYVVPLIEQDNTTQGGTLTSEQIRQLPTKSINALAATTAGVASADEGSALNIRGSRSNANSYFMDGIRVFGELPPQQDIEQLQVITGGVEAQYGDVTGGIISITTKGPSQRFGGGIEVESSQLFNNYNYNLVNANVSGPILKNAEGESILGFRLSGQYRYQKDDDPPATDIFRIKDSKLAELQENPIIFVGQSPLPAAEFLTNDDVDVLDYNPFEDETRIDLTGKIDARLSDAVDITFSGTFHRTEDQFTPTSNQSTWQVLNSHNNPTSNNQRYRGNFRFRHRLGGGYNPDQDDEARRARKGALIQNASYTLQFGYERRDFDRADPRHGDNLFNYGYIGKYDLTWEPTLQIVQKTDTSGLIFFETEHIDYTRTFQGYTPSDINPVLTRYVFNAEDAASFDEFDVVNGSIASQFTSAWSLHTNVGMVYNLNQRVRDDIITFSANTSFELLPGGSEKGRHNIQFGLLYEQRTNRGWNISPRGLWTIARLLANDHIEGQGLNLDKQIGSAEGIIFRPFDPVDPLDTIQVPIYAPHFVDPGPDAKFFRAIREAIGADLDEYVNVDGLDPSQLRLDMFSPKELNDQFATVGLNYYGYDYLGNLLDGVTFEDFFTAKDANGVRTFPVAALEPNYAAAYIQDKFTFKDIIFRLGLRVDRYDANTKVLKDPYSLYDIETAADFAARTGANIPGNIGEDFKVYVTTENGTTIQAFRDGDTWYFGDGTQANDGSEVFGGTIAIPSFVEKDATKRDITSREFDPSISFEDYEPQINWMPRLAFSFPISDEANFFAHYDILVQRPPERTRMTGLDYFYFDTKGGIKNNANLRPERTIDYEVGFQQKLTNSSAIKLAAYYRELRDMIQSRFFTNVHLPIIQYESFDNLDFGTVKGFTLQYDLRRTNNVSLNIAYTLQFADGTGSNSTSSRGLNNRGIQRILFPLSFDERHRVNVVLDYRYASGSRYNGPRIAGKDIFANAGVNLHAVAVSGRPYTAAIEPSLLGGTGTQGSINGSRLPWNFTLNLQVDKTFSLAKAGSKRPLNLNVYLRVSNLLDRRNIIRVYPFTGSPYDDGFLNSVRGADATASAVNEAHAAGFLASYQWRLINPDFFSLPRRMFLGAIFDF
ncbi:MAG: TonB-dependent receptor [Bacteroidetes bacterium]|nr:MAG: TonB-dependent receptor [Bacteroidota bacterium]